MLDAVGTHGHRSIALAEQPPAVQALDGGSGVPVALYGRAAMADAELRASIFERPALPDVPAAEIGRRVREGRRLQASDDPARNAALGGGAAIGFGGADGVDGGGF